MLKVGVDVDGPLRDFAGAVHRAFMKHRPGAVIGEHSTDYIGFNNINLPDSEKRWLIFGEWADEIYLGADVVPGAFSKFSALALWVAGQGGTVNCVTTNGGHFAEMTMKWLGSHLFRFDEYYFTGNKHLVGVNYLIDDSPLNWEQWRDSMNPEANFILMDGPYNQHINATNRVKDLGEAHKIIERMEG